jgi:telomere length regulation protein
VFSWICEWTIESSADELNVSSIVYILVKLVNHGVFPPTLVTSRSQPSFFEATLSTIRRRLDSENQHVYSALWCEILSLIPSAFTLQVILNSLLSSLTPVLPSLCPSPRQRSLVRREARFLRSLVGPLTIKNEELWECFGAVVLGRSWSEGHARIFACWVASGNDGSTTDEEGKIYPVLVRYQTWVIYNPQSLKVFRTKFYIFGRPQTTFGTPYLQNIDVRSNMPMR